MKNILKTTKSRIGKIPIVGKAVRAVPKEISYEDYIQKVEKKAYELYEKRGRQGGHDLEDWLEAEKIIENELCAPMFKIL